MLATGDIAIPAFQALIKSNYELIGLVTQPDKPVGRKQVMTPPKIKDIALESNLPVWQPERAGDEAFIQHVASLSADVIVVIAYGQILKQTLIDLPKIAIINLHASLLPKYRGAACIQAAIDAGDTESGMTAMHVVKALDAGDVILQKRLPITESTTGGILHDQLAASGPETLLETLALLEAGDAPRIPQQENEVSYISKLMRNHGEIDWTQSAEAIERRIRAYDPWPGTFTSFTDSKGKRKRLKLFPKASVQIESEGNLNQTAPSEVSITSTTIAVQCGDHQLQLGEVQPEGGRRMLASEWAQGVEISRFE